MNYLYCLKQQMRLYFAALAVMSASYYISLFIGLRAPAALSPYQFISVSLAFILLGSFFRFLTPHDQ